MALSKILPASQDQYVGARNLIINGNMAVAQRGTSATTYSNSGGFGAADRISFRRGGTWTTTTFDLSQEGTSGLDEFPKCSQIKVQDAVANPNANDDTHCNFRYAFEGNEIQHLQYGTSNAKDVTLSFYVKSPVAGTYCVQFEVNHTAADYVAEYAINSANTWEYKTITVPAPSTSEVGTKPTNDNSIQLSIYWILSGNTTGTSTARGSAGWSGTTPRTRYTVNQANAFSTLNNAVQLTGIQLEVGDVATPFEHESFAETLQKCQRYYYQTVYKGSADTTYAIGVVANSSTAAQCMAPFPVTMRAAPTFVVGGDVAVYDGDSVNTITNISANGSSTTSGTFNVDGSGLTTGRGVAIIANQSSEFLSFSSEL